MTESKSPKGQVHPTPPVQDSKYTKEDRHEIYREALHAFLKETTKYPELAKTFRRIGIDPEPPLLPELARFKPSEHFFGLWWSIRDRASRINCLLFCIEMTKK